MIKKLCSFRVLRNSNINFSYIGLLNYTFHNNKQYSCKLKLAFMSLHLINLTNFASKLVISNVKNYFHYKVKVKNMTHSNAYV